MAAAAGVRTSGGRMRLARLTVLATLTVALLVTPLVAQSLRRVYRIGWLGGFTIGELQGEQMERMKEASMFSLRILFLAPLLALFLVGSHTESQEPVRHSVVPLHKIASEKWVEKVW